MAILSPWEHPLSRTRSIIERDPFASTRRYLSLINAIERQYDFLHQNPFLRGAYVGPAIHVRRSTPPLVNDPDAYERTDSGLLIPKRGRPVGTTKVSREEFEQTLVWFVRQRFQPPTQKEMARALRGYLNKKVSQDHIRKIYVPQWYGSWSDLKRHCRELTQ